MISSCEELALYSTNISTQFVFTLAVHHIHIAAWKKAVETIACTATIYLFFGCVATLCLGGHTTVALVQFILDVAFAIGMLATTIMTRDGASSCEGSVETPLGNGESQDISQTVQLGLACRLNTAVFVLSIIATILFLCTASMQITLKRYKQASEVMSSHVSRSSSSESLTSKPAARRHGEWHARDMGRSQIAPRQWSCNDSWSNSS